MQAVLPLIEATAVRTVLCVPKYADVDVCVVYGGELDLAEKVQAVGGRGDTNRLEIAGGEGREVAVGDFLYGTEVLWFVFWKGQKAPRNGLKRAYCRDCDEA